MYFQVCSTSVYPHHLGERYRTIGSLVFANALGIGFTEYKTYLAYHPK